MVELLETLHYELGSRRPYGYLTAASLMRVSTLATHRALKLPTLTRWLNAGSHRSASRIRGLQAADYTVLSRGHMNRPQRRLLTIDRGSFALPQAGTIAVARGFVYSIREVPMPRRKPMTVNVFGGGLACRVVRMSDSGACHWPAKHLNEFLGIDRTPSDPKGLRA
jgi:hypothetical protein